MVSLGVSSDGRNARILYTIDICGSERWILKLNENIMMTRGEGIGIVSVRSHLEQFDIVCALRSVKRQPINQATILKHPRDSVGKGFKLAFKLVTRKP